MYVIQSSNLASIGINPSLFTDSVGEFNFFKGKKIFYILRVTKYTQMQPMCNNTIKDKFKRIWIEFSLLLMTFNGALHELANTLYSIAQCYIKIIHHVPRFPTF